VPPLCENTTTSTKPEVHYVLHCHQKQTEPRPRVTYTDNFVKFGHVVFEICQRTYIQITDIHTETHTDTLIAISRTPLGGEVKNNSNLNSGNAVLYRTVGPANRLQRYDVLYSVLFVALQHAKIERFFLEQLRYFMLHVH